MPKRINYINGEYKTFRGSLYCYRKNHPADVITEALSLGVTTIGENRVQEARAKREMLGAVGRWHLIGHLQTNKAKQAVAIFDMIESADSLHLMQKLDEEAAKAGKVQEVLLQVNIAREEQKTRVRCRKFYFKSTSPARNRKPASAPKITQQSCRSWTALKTCMCAA